MLTWASHHFSSLPMLRSSVPKHPSDDFDRHVSQKLKNDSLTWKVTGGEHEGTYTDKLNFSKAKSTASLTFSSVALKFRPKDHGFTNSREKCDVKIVDSSSSKSFGTVVLPSGAHLSRVRSLLTSSSDSTAYVFLDASGSDIPMVSEAKFSVGLIQPKILSVSIPILPPMKSEQPENTGEAEGTPKKKKKPMRLTKGFTNEDIALVADSKLQEKGKKMLSRIKDLIRQCEITVDEWFSLMDSSGAAESDGTVSSLELRKGLKALCMSCKKKVFSENEVVNLLRYMDPNADGDLSKKEVEDAIERSTSEDSEETRLIERNQDTLCKLEEHMKKKGIRLNDLFTSLDATGDALLSPEELRTGFITIADPSKRGRLNPPVMQKDKALIENKKEEVHIRKTVIVKVRILDADQSLLHNREALRLSASPIKPLKPSHPPLKLEPKFLEITDEQINQLSSKLGSLLSYPIKSDTLMTSLSKIPQIDDILKHLDTSWQKMGDDVVTRMRSAEAGSFQLTDEDITKLLKFLDPSNDGEIDMDELVSAFRVVRRGRAGIKQRAQVLESLKNAKPVTQFEILAEKGRVLMEREAKILADKKSAADAILAKKESQRGKMISKKDRMMMEMSKSRDDAQSKRELGKEAALKSENQEKAAVAKKEAEEFGGFSNYEIDVVVHFMDPGGDNCISLDEMMDAFRKSRRAKAVEKTTNKGRKVLRRILNMIKMLDLTLVDFFDIVDGVGKNDGSISIKELKIGVKHLTAMARHMLLKEGKEEESMSKAYKELSESEAVLLMKVADPSGEGELSLEEFKKAVEQSQELTEAQRIEARVGGVFKKLEKLMKDKGLRLQDLFLLFGGDDGSITGQELKEGLVKLGLPSAKARSEEKRALRAAIIKKGEDERKRKVIMEEINRIEFAEESGAAEVLRKFEELMSERGMRISDLFRKIDKSGDGLVSREELKEGLLLLSQPCPTAVFAQKKLMEKELLAHKKEVEKRKELRHFLTRMHEARESGAAEVIERIEIFLRNNQMRVQDMFRVLDGSGDGALDEEELGGALKKVHLECTSEEVSCLMKYLDAGGNGLVEAVELSEAIRSYRRFRWEAMAIDFDLDHRPPLFEEFSSYEEIFHPSDLFGDGLEENDVAVGLKRLRGDDMIDEMMIYSHSETEHLKQSFEKLCNHLHNNNTDLKSALKSEDDHGHGVKIESFVKFLEQCRTKPLDRSDRTRNDSSTLDDGSIFSQFTDMQSVNSLETMNTLDTTVTSNTAKYNINLTPESFGAVANFLDGGDGVIEMKELEVAFRMARRAKVEEMLKRQGVQLMKRLRKLLEYKKMNLDKFVSLMDSATGKTQSGISIGDGNVTAREFKVGLQKMSNAIDKKHRYLKFSSKEVSDLLRYIDPSGTGNMSASTLKAAFFSNASPEEIEASFQQEQQELESDEIIDDFAADIVVPNKETITQEDISVLIASIDETEDGDVNMAELENMFRVSRRANAQKRLDDKAIKVLKRVQKLLKKLNLDVKGFFHKMDGSGSAEGNGIVTGRELKTGLQELCKDASVSGFNENDLVFLVRFLDPSGEGDLSKDEMEEGFRKAGGLQEKEPQDDDDEVQRRIGSVITKLEDFMKNRGMRLSDLFYWLDRSGDGKLGFKELQGGLERLIFGQSTEDRIVAMQLLSEVRAKEKVEMQKQIAEQAKRDARFAFLNESGAGDVLRGLEDLMKDKGMRIHDVFHTIDESGDGLIDREELIAGLSKLIKPTKGVAASKIAKEKRRLREQAEAEERQRKMNIFLGKIEESERCGADVVIHRLERFMRKRQMKLTDLFATLDKGGDGTLTAEELQVALEKENLMMTDEEILNLMEFLDKGGDGEIDAKELEAAIKLHRRYAWEQKNKGGILFRPSEIELLTKFVSHSGSVHFVSLDHLAEMEKKSNLLAGRSTDGGDNSFPGTIWAGADDELSTGSGRPSTSQQTGRAQSRQQSRQQSRLQSRGGLATPAPLVEEEELGLEARDKETSEAEQKQQAETFVDDVIWQASQQVEDDAAKSNALVNIESDNLGFGRYTLTGKEEEGEGKGEGEGEQDWEQLPVKAPIWDDASNIDSERPFTDTQRPVTAPSGAFEFDLGKGEWQGAPGQQPSGGEGGGGDEESVVVEEMKKTLNEKDEYIMRLEAELMRMRKGEGSVVSEITMAD
ncbi:hypothetical protein TrST_g2624 [Triparma strigata]|uniref:EF-hand domain-containing protein n=1 Tax=Triparma strigata TaxID=1606541 RepID=A0A9W7AJ21_9STRA|nr:hypothetical protein TrST_g2624 [Triparma strigata]